MQNYEGYGVSKTSPWVHQRNALDYAMRTPAVGLWYDMGTGKSKIAVDLIRNTNAKRTVILCPKSVIDVWPKQFETHCADPVPRILTFKKSWGSVKKAAVLEEALKDPSPLVVVLNYESARMHPLGPKIGKSGRMDQANLGLFLNTKWDIVICDEAHRVKSYSSKISKFAWHLGKRAERRVGLSGTPIPHSPLDAFGVYRFLDPAIFGVYYTPFRARYAIMGGFTGLEVRGFQNLDELTDKMNTIALTVKASDVLDLPEVRDIWLWCELGAKARKAYDELEQELITYIEGEEITLSNMLVKSLRLQQITGGAVNSDEGNKIEVDDSKKQVLSDLLEDIPPDDPVVVFGRFSHDLEMAHRCCYTERKGKRTYTRNFYELSGKQNQLAEWQAATDGGVLAVQIQSGGVGVDLTRSRYCVYYSTGFSLGDYLQSRARVHRPGQDRNVVYYHLGARNTIDITVAKALEKKEDLVESVLASLKKGV